MRVKGMVFSRKEEGRFIENIVKSVESRSDLYMQMNRKERRKKADQKVKDIKKGREKRRR